MTADPFGDKFDLRFDAIASLELQDATYAKEIATFALSNEGKPFPRSTALFFKLNGNVRACLFVQDADTSTAIRFAYHPLLLHVNAFPALRKLVYRRHPDFRVDLLSPQEQFDFLHLGETMS